MFRLRIDRRIAFVVFDPSACAVPLGDKDREGVIFRSIVTCLSALLLGGLLTSASPAEAAFPWRRPPAPQNAYAPQVRNYAVVSPTPVASKYGVYGSSMLWAEQRPTTPAYPWGWFGTHNSPQGFSHTGYYGGHRDLGLIREQ